MRNNAGVVLFRSRHFGNRHHFCLLFAAIIAFLAGYVALAKKPDAETPPVAEDDGLVAVQLSQKIKQAQKFLEQNKFDQAEKILHQILALNPDPGTEALARQMLADALCYTKHYENAAEELEQAIALGTLSAAKEFYAYVELIRLKIKLFDYDAVPALLAQVEQKFLSPTSPMYTTPDNFPPADRTYFVLAEMLWNSGMPEEALKYASIVAGFQTSRGREAAIIAAQALEAMGQIDPAISIMEQALGEFDNENPKILARVYYALIKLALKHKAPSVAISLAEEGRNRFNGEMAAKYSYHVAQMIQKSLKDGGREFMEAVAASEFEGVRIGALDNLIGMALEQKQWAKVEEYCLRVLSLSDCPPNRYLENSIALMTALAMQEKDISVVLESLMDYTQKKGSSKNGYSTYRIAKELEKLGRKDKAESLYSGILKKGWKEEWAGRSAFQMVDIYVQNGQLQEAADLLSDFIVYQEKEGDRKESIRGITKLLEIPGIENIQNPAQLIHAIEDNLSEIQDPDLLLNLAALLTNRKMTGQARKCVDMALALAETILQNMTPQERISRETLICRRLYELGDLDSLLSRIDAISSDIFNDPLVKLEEYAELKFYMGFALWNTGHEEEASAIFEHILGLLAGNEDFYPNIAVNIAVLYRETNPAKYQELIESAIMLSPSSFGASLGRIWLGIDALLVNDIDAAEAYAQAILANTSPSSEIEWTRDLYWNGLFLEGYVMAARQLADGEATMKKAVSRGGIMDRLKNLAETRWPAAVVPDEGGGSDPNETGSGSKGGGSTVPHPPVCRCSLDLTLDREYLGIDMVDPRCENTTTITATADYSTSQSCNETYSWHLSAPHAKTNGIYGNVMSIIDICEPSILRYEEIVTVSGCCCERSARFTAVRVNINIGKSEAEEENPGACVVLNGDDDNLNMVIDRKEQPLDPAIADDDLVAFTLSIEPGSNQLPPDEVISLSGSGLQFCYEDQEKQIPASGTYTVGELPKPLYIEGKQPGVYDLNLEHDLSGAIDKAVFKVLNLDLDMDSDHTTDFGGPDPYCDLEDLIEAGTGIDLYRGLKYVVANEYHDADIFGIPGYADGFDRDDDVGTPDDDYAPAMPVASPLLVPLHVEIGNYYPNPDDTEICFVYAGTRPEDTGVSEPDGEIIYPSPGAMRLWDSNGARKKQSVLENGNFIPFDQWFPLADYAPSDLYLEGIGPKSGLEADQIEIKMRNIPSGWPELSDTVKFSIIRVDVDIDSDNNNGFGTFPQSWAEDHYEDIEGDPNRLGKIMVVNDNDDDGDGIPDFADGYDLLPDNPDDDINASEQFVPIIFELPEPIDPTKARVTIHYAGESDPWDVTVDDEGIYHCGEGTLRLWTKPGHEARNMNTIDTDGDFIVSTDYSAEEFGFANGIRTLTYYLEAVGPSSEIADQRIVFKVDPNGNVKNPPNYLAADAVRVTVLDVDIAMDGNRDNEIRFDDPNDAKYLFWVNTDIDVRYQNTEDDGSPWEEDDCQIGNHNRNDVDYADNIINCKRDLEDFTRLHIKVDDNTANLSGITYFLKIDNAIDGPAVNVYEAVDTSSDYLSDTIVAADQIQKQNLAPDGIGTTEVPIDTQYIKSGNQVSSFIIEGRHEGKGDLTFIVKKGQAVICRKSVQLELHTMDWFVDIYRTTVTSGDTTDVYVDDTAVEDQAAEYPAQSGEYFLFVHGWNMPEWEKERWAETVFKRLWWQGYKGKVGLFSWPTLSGFQGTLYQLLFETRHFDNSEFRSWLSSDSLKCVFDFLNTAGELRVLAHSMGNVVSGEAIRKYSGTLHTYVASQAALPAHCYDNTVSVLVNQELYDVPWWPFDPDAPITTPNLYGYYPTGMHGTDPYLNGNQSNVLNLWNYYNVNDWALVRWELNNVLKPDGAAPYLYGYMGRTSQYEEGVDRFARGPIDNPTEILSVDNERQNYQIFAYCVESRVKALGQVTLGGGFSTWDLATSSLRYNDEHYSHSREFRSNVADEWSYWSAIMQNCDFTSTVPQE
ncbi:MAG: tetratricopeptide repeat protein [Kiritimatiellia bacterium]